MLFIIIYNKKNVVLLDISDFDDLYTKSLEEFSIKEKPDNLLSLYSYIKNAKMMYRVPIGNKLVRNKLIGFRLISLNIFVYKINKLIYFILSELHYILVFYSSTCIISSYISGTSCSIPLVLTINSSSSFTLIRALALSL